MDGPMWIWLASCASPPEAPAVRFVRDGIVVRHGSGRTVPDGVLIERPWTPGLPLDIDGTELVAPLLAECLPLWSVALGGSDALARGDGPDTALAFSPDG